MKQVERNGYAIILAVVAIALVGAAVLVLVDTSDTLMFDSKLSYLHACQRNLCASGLAWVRQNPEKLGVSSVRLDVEQLGVAGGTLMVVGKVSGAKVQINTQCGQGKMKLKGGDTYVLRSER